MTTEVDVVTGNMSIEELVAEFDRTYHHGFPVVSEDTGELIGVVTLQDLKSALARGDIEKKVVREIATTYGILVAYPDEPMWEALRRMASRDVGRLPVLAKKDSNELVGVIRRRDIIKAYNHAIMKKAHHQHRFDIIRLGNLDSSKFMHVEIPAHSSIVGKQIREIELPDDCLIVSIRRGRKLRVAHGYTQINANDKLTVFAHQDCAPYVHDALSVSEDVTEEPDED